MTLIEEVWEEELNNYARKIMPPEMKNYRVKLVEDEMKLDMIDENGKVIRTSQEILYWIHQLIEERIECSKWWKAWKNKDRIKELNTRYDSLLKEMTISRERELGIKRQTGPKWQAIYDEMEEESK